MIRMIHTPHDHLPPVVPVAYSALASNLVAWGSAARSVADYSARVLERPDGLLRVPLDAAHWMRLMTERRKPHWASENTVVSTTALTRVRDFSQGNDDVVPTLVVAPQAGHDSCIVDYNRHQSQMQVLLATGLTRLYAMEWLGATRATRNASIEDYVAEIERAVDIAGGEVNLVGDCQGGWLATVYAALHPERVHSLTIAGAPIDFHAGSGPISDWVQLLTRKGRDMSFFKALVAAGGGLLKGEFMVGGFISIRPENELSRQVQLLAHLDDPHHLERYRDFEDWFKYTQDIAGKYYLWIVEHLFARNELIRGELMIGERKVDLKRISCPIQLLAGEDDHISPPEQVFALADAVSTPPSKITLRTAAGGHLGLFMGRKALRDDWPAVMAPVATHSRRGLRLADAERHGHDAVTTHGDRLPLPA